MKHGSQDSCNYRYNRKPVGAMQIKCVHDLKEHFLPDRWYGGLGSSRDVADRFPGTSGDALKVSEATLVTLQPQPPAECRQLTVLSELRAHFHGTGGLSVTLSRRRWPSLK